jgi:hypothetical protein
MNRGRSCRTLPAVLPRRLNRPVKYKLGVEDRGVGHVRNRRDWTRFGHNYQNILAHATHETLPDFLLI